VSTGVVSTVGERKKSAEDSRRASRLKLGRSRFFGSTVTTLTSTRRRIQEAAMTAADVREAVRDKYGSIARAVESGAGCCGPSACGCGDPITSNLYSKMETGGLPDKAVAASLGCGNPTALVALQPGQIVLDLGSGGGIDVLLSAKRVGP